MGAAPSSPAGLAAAGPRPHAYLRPKAPRSPSSTARKRRASPSSRRSALPAARPSLPRQMYRNVSRSSQRSPWPRNGSARTVLFNHAGSIVVKPFLETTDEDYDWLMDTNVRSMFLMTRAVLPGMLAAGGGAIVNTSSISAVAATPMEVLYGTTKGAVHMFSRAIAVEYRDRGIRCNAVCPGFIRTAHGMREVETLARYGVDVSDAALAAQQGRMCEPEEVAKVALFLASDEASFVNGAHLFVDNCFTAV